MSRYFYIRVRTVDDSDNETHVHLEHKRVDFVKMVRLLAEPHHTGPGKFVALGAARQLIHKNISSLQAGVGVILDTLLSLAQSGAERHRKVLHAPITLGALDLEELPMHLEDGPLACAVSEAFEVLINQLAFQRIGRPH